jgi:hypothetical protein
MKVFNKIMDFKLRDKIDGFNEEKSLIKLRVIYGLFLGGDLKDGKRVKRLNRTHIETMEIIKEMAEQFNSVQNNVNYTKKVEESWEPSVPRCNEIYGIFCLNVNDFIEGVIRKYIDRSSFYDRDDIIKENFNRFTVSTIDAVF